MERKDFLRKGLLSLGSIPLIQACSKDDVTDVETGNCEISPAETNGPYPIKSASSYQRSDIVGDRQGVPMTFICTVQDLSNNCEPLSDVFVDIWHCDKDGNYSQYGSFTSVNWLRGRQTTGSDGKVTFTSIFPGWYPGRAPHIHIEILSASGSSLLVSQIAFPVDVYNAVYASTGYNGAPDTSNTQDGIFSNSLSGNMANSVTGSVSAGYTVSKTITVA